MPGPGPRGPRGPKPQVENPGKLMGRLLKYVGKNYGIHLVIVAVCIFVSVIANVQGTMFMKNLIDLYIMPMIGQSSPDFGPLLGAILKVAVFYLIGVLATFSYNRIMVYVTQGTLKNLRNDMFHHMESLPIKYFDTHAHGRYHVDLHERYRYAASDDQPEYATAVIQCDHDCQCLCQHDHPEYTADTRISGDDRHHAVYYEESSRTERADISLHNRNLWVR